MSWLRRGQTGSVHSVRVVGGRGDEVLETEVVGGLEAEVVESEELVLWVVALGGEAVVLKGAHMEPKRLTAMTSVRVPSVARPWRWFCGLVAQTSALKKASRTV